MGHRLLWRVLRDGFLAFRGQLSEPQVNLKNNDEPEPKPPARNIFALVFVFFLVPVRGLPKCGRCDVPVLHAVLG